MKYSFLLRLYTVKFRPNNLKSTFSQYSKNWLKFSQIKSDKFGFIIILYLKLKFNISNIMAVKYKSIFQLT